MTPTGPLVSVSIPAFAQVARVTRLALSLTAVALMMVAGNLFAGETPAHAGTATEGHPSAVWTEGGGAPAMSLEVAGDTTPLGRFVIARRLLIGAETSHDPALVQQALGLLAAAAEEGFTPAARFAASLFLEGKLVDRNPKVAVRWFLTAARQGDVAAQRALGDLYAEGDQIPQDLVRAAEWYETALANPGANYKEHRLYEIAVRLGELYAEGLGVNWDPQLARDLWQRAADEGEYPPAYTALARAQADGIGGPRDVRGALKAYYTAAALYREAGLRFAIGHQTAQRERADILRAMDDLSPRAGLTRKLRGQLNAGH